MAIDLLDEAQAAWGLAMQIELEIELAELRPAFDELADAVLVWLDGRELEQLTVRALDALWTPAVAAAIERRLLQLVHGVDDDETGLEAARALGDLHARGRASEIAIAVAQHVAMQLG